MQTRNIITLHIWTLSKQYNFKTEPSSPQRSSAEEKQSILLAFKNASTWPILQIAIIPRYDRLHLSREPSSAGPRAPFHANDPRVNNPKPPTLEHPRTHSGWTAYRHFISFKPDLPSLQNYLLNTDNKNYLEIMIRRQPKSFQRSLCYYWLYRRNNPTVIFNSCQFDHYRHRILWHYQRL